MNIDLNGFTQEYYEWLGGGLEPVKRSIALAAEQCHVELFRAATTRKMR